MPTPFPGMDPYLEHPALWPDVHNALIATIRNVLVPQLRPRYYVALEERTYLAEPGSLTFVSRPDVTVVGTPRAATLPPGLLATAFPGSTALESVVVELPLPELFRETYLEVRVAQTHAVITVLELLSPANKRPGEGRRQYVEKRQQVLGTFTHLVEIDLLRHGEPMTMETYGRDVTSHYRLLVSRAEHRPLAFLVPFTVRDPIPGFRLPLQAGDDEPLVYLNHLVHTLYDDAGYDLRIDYRAEPMPALQGDDARWAETLLQAAGRR